MAGGGRSVSPSCSLLAAFLLGLSSASPPCLLSFPPPGWGRVWEVSSWGGSLQCLWGTVSLPSGHGSGRRSLWADSGKCLTVSLPGLWVKRFGCLSGEFLFHSLLPPFLTLCFSPCQEVRGGVHTEGPGIRHGSGPQRGRPCWVSEVG